MVIKVLKALKKTEKLYDVSNQHSKTEVKINGIYQKFKVELFLYRTTSNVTASNEDESNIDDREDVVDSESSQSTSASSCIFSTTY